jgi:hypothetical protein
LISWFGPTAAGRPHSDDRSPNVGLVSELTVVERSTSRFIIVMLNRTGAPG